MRIVGTNTLRVATNAEEFLQEAQQLLGHPIEIVSGREEARLIYLGVAHGRATREGKRLVVDIGGGSTELIIGEGKIPCCVKACTPVVSAPAGNILMTVR